MDTFDLDIREPFDFYDGIIKNQYFGANVYVNHKLGPKNFFQLGIEAILNDYDFNDSVYYASDALYRPLTNTSGNTGLLQPYFTWQFKPGVRWIINALGGKEFELNKKTPKADRKKIMYIVLDSKVTFAGGNRYTPIDLESSQKAGEVVYDEDNAFSLQLDPYFRWDLRLGFKMLGRKTTQEWTFDVSNLTNRKNAFSVSFNPQTGEEVLVTQLGIFPVFQYRIYF